MAADPTPTRVPIRLPDAITRYRDDQLADSTVAAVTGPGHDDVARIHLDPACRRLAGSGTSTDLTLRSVLDAADRCCERCVPRALRGHEAFARHHEAWHIESALATLDRLDADDPAHDVADVAARAGWRLAHLDHYDTLVAETTGTGFDPATLHERAAAARAAVAGLDRGRVAVALRGPRRLLDAVLDAHLGRRDEIVETAANQYDVASRTAVEAWVRAVLAHWVTVEGADPAERVGACADAADVIIERYNATGPATQVRVVAAPSALRTWSDGAVFGTWEAWRDAELGAWQRRFTRLVTEAAEAALAGHRAQPARPPARRVLVAVTHDHFATTATSAGTLFRQIGQMRWEIGDAGEHRIVRADGALWHLVVVDDPPADLARGWAVSSARIAAVDAPGMCDPALFAAALGRNLDPTDALTLALRLDQNRPPSASRPEDLP